MLAKSAAFTSMDFPSRRIRFGFFVPSRWRLPERIRMILPVDVILSRFAAPRCDFNFVFLAKLHLYLY